MANPPRSRRSPTRYKAAGGTWVDSAIAGGEAARSAAINRIVGGNPSTAAQFNTSQQFLDIVTGRHAQQRRRGRQEERLGQDPPGADPQVDQDRRPLLRRAGQHPHARLVLVLEGARSRRPASPPSRRRADEFFAALDKLKAAGITPVAFGGQPWQEKIVFDALLAHIGGSDLYLKVYKGDQKAIASPEFKNVLASFKQLKSYTDAGSPNRNWNDATSMVISGKAGVQIMGDWAKGEFQAAKQTAGKEFGCFPGFGPKAPYIIAGDVFVFPKTTDAAAIKSQQLLATVMTSPATQVAFNNKKGSIPIRTDVDAKSMDICAQQGIAAMKDVSRQLPNSEMLVGPDITGALQDVVTKFWNTNQSVDDAVKAVGAAVKG